MGHCALHDELRVSFFADAVIAACALRLEMLHAEGQTRSAAMSYL